jgi:membrane protease subunit (stomatin/prohibitin family)
MSNQKLSPEQSLASMFAGLSRREQMILLGKLEFAGAGLYRSLAADEKNLKAREALLKSAEREESNGNLLRLMTTPKDRCEKCGIAIPAGNDAYACSFQCTFCGDCADGFGSVCPNCGGQLERSPRAEA